MDFSTYKVISDDGVVNDASSVALIMFSKMVQKLLMEHNNASNLKTQIVLENYYLKNALSLIQKMDYQGDVHSLKQDIKEVIHKISAAMLEANSQLKTDPIKLMLISSYSEMTKFFSQTADILVDELRVLACDHNNAIDEYKTVIQITQSGHQWLYESLVKDGISTRVLTLDGVISPMLSDDADQLNKLFSMLVMEKHDQIIIDTINKELLESERVVNIAQQIVKVVGGDHKDFLMLVADLTNPSLFEDNLNSKERGIAYILKKETRANPKQIKQITQALLVFETFMMDHQDKMTIINPENFELWLLCSMISNYLLKIENDERALTQDKQVPNFIGYFDFILMSLAEFEAAFPIITSISHKLEDHLYAAKAVLYENQSKLKVGDFEQEFWWFCSEAMSRLITVKTLNNSHSKIKRSNNEYEHKTRLQYTHGGNAWVFNVHIKGNQGVEIKTFFNKADITKESPLTMQAELGLIYPVLQKIALSTAMSKGFDYLVSIADKEPRTVKRAQLIAGVLGGDYKSYLLTAKYFDDSFEALYKTTMMSKDEVVKHILNRELRVDQEQIEALTQTLLA